MRLTGRRYEAHIDAEKVGICHCSDCQRLTGSAFSVFVPVARERIRLTGELRVYVKTAQSGNRRAQAFCATCGTRIYASPERDPQVLNLRVGTIDERAQLRPRIQLWCRSALPWVNELGAMPAVPTQP
jgi:hypothetical protein